MCKGICKSVLGRGNSGLGFECSCFWFDGFGISGFEFDGFGFDVFE